MTAWSSAVLDELASSFEHARDGERATQMAAYMRNQFPFFGIAAADRRRLVGQALRAAGSGPHRAVPDEADLTEFARACYERREREFHYAAVNLLRRRLRTLTPASMPLLHDLITTQSWWDTVDEIAAHLVGGVVRAHPELVSLMDAWVESDNLWVARSAVLHQLMYKDQTDPERLFAYCLARADEPDFFYRKAIGWALRQYARTDPEAVAAFCTQHRHALSPLSYREATKHLDV